MEAMGQMELSEKVRSDAHDAHMASALLLEKEALGAPNASLPGFLA